MYLVTSYQIKPCAEEKRKAPSKNGAGLGLVYAVIEI